MKIREAMRMVMEGDISGIIIYKGQIDPSDPKYTDFKYGKTEISKKVIQERERLAKEKMVNFAIIKTDYENRLINGNSDFLIVFEEGDVSVDKEAEVGDKVFLNITSNRSAEWSSSFICKLDGRKIVKKTKRELNAHKFVDRTKARAERDQWRNLSKEQVEEIQKELWKSRDLLKTRDHLSKTS